MNASLRKEDSKQELEYVLGAINGKLEIIVLINNNSLNKNELYQQSDQQKNIPPRKQKWAVKICQKRSKESSSHLYTLPSKEELCFLNSGSTFGIASGVPIVTAAASRPSCRMMHGIPT